MIVITGGAGFIGSNLVRGLNARGEEDILVVDEFARGAGPDNLRGCAVLDCVDKSDFRSRVQRGDPGLRQLRAIVHQGACTNTLERDEQYLLENNFRYSMDLLRHCVDNRIPLIYASSAAVYGSGTDFRERPECEAPINLYGVSKKLFDDQVRECLPRSASQVAGLRYFNVYGPREEHKGKMASVAFHLNRQLQAEGRVKLFRGSGGFGDGEQRRDFVFVGDVVKVNLWFLDHAGKSGIFNVGTGRDRSFNDVAGNIIRWHGTGSIEYIPFPDELAGAYQNFTRADLYALRRAGYTDEFLTLEDGLRQYFDWQHAAQPQVAGCREES
ncbi:MAG: ADP-glyceromanno-heptose 6-epimerase [Gammaproteobacteria bacterium]|nr:ADP-glyceromanno-heptose 6-epimerase [Gammaproteobacteria bacterium]